MAWTRETWPVEVLRRAAETVGSAVEGDRHRALYSAAAECGHYVADGTLDAARVEHDLTAAAARAGMAGRAGEVARTISAGVGRGQAGRAWYPAPGGSAPTRRTVTWGGRVLLLRTGRPALSDDGLAAMALPTTVAASTVRVTWYRALRDTRGDGGDWTWQELAEAVGAPMEWPAGGKADLPLWSLAEIEGDDRGRRRDAGSEGDRDPETYRVHGLVLDYDDDPTWSLEQVRSWWGEVQYVAHSSASHGAEKDGDPVHGRGRVILALSRPVTVDEYTRLAEWVLHCGRGVVGQAEIRSTRRAYFVPARAPGGYVGEAHLCGRAIDVDAFLEQLVLAERQALDEEVAEQPDPTVWARLDMLARGQQVVPRDHLLNLTQILGTDPRWTGRLRWSDFTGTPELDGAGLTDEAEGHAAVWLGRVYGVHPPPTRLHEAIRVVCHRHRYHPVREYLDGLRWDGVSRLDTWLVVYAGCERDEVDPDAPVESCPPSLTCAYGTRWMISGVARIYEPGCKVDHALVLRGRQGGGKSRLIRTLAGPAWFSDSALPIGDRDGYQGLRGVWLYELSELDSIRRSDWSAVKAFLSAQIDRYRPSYGRNTIEVARQVVFAGSTNEAAFLGDSSGSRRFWVRRIVAPMDLEALARDRDQLWAEAVHRYRAGEQWWLTAEEEDARGEDAEHYRIVDPWEDAIGAWLGGKSQVTVAEILTRALGRDLEAATKGDEMRVAGILASLGWQRARVMIAGRRVVRWTGP